MRVVRVSAVFAVFAIVAVAVVAIGACPAPFERCNADEECARPTLCIDGLCQEPLDGEGEGDVAEGEGEGDLGEGEGDVGEGEGEGEGEGDDAGEGEGDGPACDVGAHDGGDGACVLDGACSPGFALAYADTDGDGRGGGALTNECVDPNAVEVGFSMTTDDCAPSDAAGFVFGDFFPDLDGDGFTTAAVTVCGDGAVPPLHRATAQRAPIVAALPLQADGDSGPESNWDAPHDIDRVDDDEATVDVDAGEPSDFIEVGDFLCGVLPAARDGLEVRAVAANVNDGDAHEIELKVTLVDDGTEIAQQTRTDDWPPDALATTFVLGGPADTWGGALANLDPCAPSFSLRATLVPTEFNGDAGIDALIVLVYGVDDCDDGDAAVATPAIVYEDDDGDLYGAGVGTSGCFSLATVLASALRDTDCRDDELNVYPFQNTRFTVPTQGGGFDYDCNGSESANTIPSVTTCVDDGNGICTSSATTNLSGACGAAVNVQECATTLPCGGLESTSGTERIGCR